MQIVHSGWGFFSVSLGGEGEYEEGMMFSGLERVMARMSVLGYGDTDTAARHEAAILVLEGMGIRYEVSQIDVQDDGSVRYCFCVRESIDKIIDANFEIAERLSAEFKDSLAGLITYSCIPFHEDVHGNAEGGLWQ